VKDAIKNHQVLVGMNREMVIYSKGRPPKKVREKNGETEYEDWIYGEPPHDVDFIRMIGDRVARVETMKVNGEKLVRTEKEIDLEPEPSVAKQEPPGPKPPGAPSLKRPGEDLPGTPDTVTVPTNGKIPPPIAPAPPPGKDQNPVPN